MPAHECSDPDCTSRLHQKEEDANCYRYLEWSWVHLQEDTE